jgi:hypothetical protein
VEGDDREEQVQEQGRLRPRKGKIMLTEHGDETWFRNIRISRRNKVVRLRRNRSIGGLVAAQQAYFSTSARSFSNNCVNWMRRSRTILA